jgi:hypothetical protein
VIPTPRGVITGAFGGKDKKTFYILARGATDANGTEVPNAAQVWSIQMQAQGTRTAQVGCRLQATGFVRAGSDRPLSLPYPPPPTPPA